MKYNLEISQCIRYNHTITVETDMTEEEMEELMNDFERQSNAEESYFGDIPYYFREKGIEVIETCEDEDGQVNDITCENIEALDE